MRLGRFHQKTKLLIEFKKSLLLTTKSNSKHHLLAFSASPRVLKHLGRLDATTEIDSLLADEGVELVVVLDGKHDVSGLDLRLALSSDLLACDISEFSRNVLHDGSEADRSVGTETVGELALSEVLGDSADVEVGAVLVGASDFLGKLGTYFKRRFHHRERGLALLEAVLLAGCFGRLLLGSCVEFSRSGVHRQTKLELVI